MTSKPTRAVRTPAGRRQRFGRSPLAAGELLETREMLSALSLVSTRVIWLSDTGGARTVARFDAQGNLLNVRGPEAALHAGGRLGGGTSAPDRIALKFNQPLDATTVAAFDFSISGDGVGADPFRVVQARVPASKPNLARLFTIGTLNGSAKPDGTDRSITLAITGIRGQGAAGEWVTPTQFGLRVGGTGQTTPCLTNCQDPITPRLPLDAPPQVQSIAPSPDAVVTGTPGPIVVTFSEDVTGVASGTVNIVRSGGDGGFGDGNEIPLPAAVTYNSVSRQATVQLAGRLPEDIYEVRLTSDGIRDAADGRLDGNRDGRAGGDYVARFRVDTTAPQVDLQLSNASDTGRPQDALTRQTDRVGVLARVTDSPLAAPENYRVELDVDGDGFDDGSGVTDRIGLGLAVSDTPLAATGTQTLRVRVTDLAGNTTTATLPVTVDTTSPLVTSLSPSGDLASSPTSLQVTFSEDIPQASAESTQHYVLIGSGGDGIFYNGSADRTALIQSVSYHAASRTATVQLSQSLPPDAYRFLVASDSGLADVAGNRLGADASAEFEFGLPEQPLPRFGADNGGVLVPEVEVLTVERAGTARTGGGTESVARVSSRRVPASARIVVREQEPVGGPARTNDNIAQAEDLRQSIIPLGLDPNEDSTVLIVGQDFGNQDRDFYRFMARAGEIVRFSIFQDTGQLDGQGLPFSNTPLFTAKLTLWDLGTNDIPGGLPGTPSADRRLIANADFTIGAAGFIQVETMITALTGIALDQPNDQTLNPLGTEDRSRSSVAGEPRDREYALEIDADIRGPGVPQVSYLALGQMFRPYTVESEETQIVYVDWDGAQNVPGFLDLNGDGDSDDPGEDDLDIPAFDVNDYGLDPIFTDPFIDATMDEMREDLERVRSQGINSDYSFELQDSRHYPDPGDQPNVTRVIIGGNGSLVGDLTGGLLGIADDVDIGNRNGDNRALVFSQSLARFRLGSQFPIGFGPSRIAVLAADLADTIASHELGHVLGLRHTASDLVLDPITGQTVDDVDGIMDTGAIQDLEENLIFRFDCLGNGVLGVTIPVGGTCLRGFQNNLGLEDVEGVTDSIGELAWGLATRRPDAFAPRVIDIDVAPRRMEIAFSEAIDPTSLLFCVQGTVSPCTVRLARLNGDNDFDEVTDEITLVPLVPSTSLNFDADRDSFFDPNSDRLVLRISPGAQLPPDLYRLSLVGTTEDLDLDGILDANEDANGNNALDRGIVDSSGNTLDGEFPGIIAPTFEALPSGNFLPGGDFVFEFRVSPEMLVDGDVRPTEDTNSNRVLDAGEDTNGNGLLDRPTGESAFPFGTIQEALREARFASLGNPDDTPTLVRISPSSAPYQSPDPGPDGRRNTADDLGAIVVPDNVYLVLDGRELGDSSCSFDAVIDDDTVPTSAGCQVSGGPGIATVTLTQAATVLNEVLYVVDGAAQRILRVRDSGICNQGPACDALPLPAGVTLTAGSRAGLAYDGSRLFFVDSTPATDSIFVLDARTGALQRRFQLPAAPGDLAGLAFGGGSLFGIDPVDSRIYVFDPTTGSLREDFQVRGAGNAIVALGSAIDYDTTSDTLFLTTAETTPSLLQFDPVTKKTIGGAIPLTIPNVTGLAARGDQLFVSDSSGAISEIDRRTGTPLGTINYTVAGFNPAPLALAGGPAAQIVVKMQSSRMDVAGENAGIIAIGTPDRPVVFTSTRDDAVFGDTNLDGGISSGQAGDWLGVVFRQDSNDFASVLENVSIRNAGGSGEVVPGFFRSLNAVQLFDARPTLRNVEIINNLQAAIGATPDSFERIDGREGPDITWDVDPGLPIVGSYSDSTGTSRAQFALYQRSTGDFAIDRNRNRTVDETDDRNCNGVFDPNHEDRNGDGVFTANNRLEDRNRNGTFDLCERDLSFTNPNLLFRRDVTVPIKGKWRLETGRGITAPTSTADMVGVFNRATGEFQLDFNGNALFDDVSVFAYGGAGDLPVVGDWDGDGDTDLGVFNPLRGEWRLDVNGDRIPNDELFTLLQNATSKTPLLGTPFVGNFTNTASATGGDFCYSGDVPLTGLACDEIGILASGTSAVFIDLLNANHVIDSEDANNNGLLDLGEDLNGNSQLDSDGPFTFGQSTDIPQPMNWRIETNLPTAQQITELAVYRPGGGQWFIDFDEDSNGNGVLDTGEDRDRDGKIDGSHFLDPTDGPFQFGAAGDLPAAGDFDADGKADLAVFRAATGAWLVDDSGDRRHQPTEDTNLNGKLDTGEDRDGDGVLDSNEGPLEFTAALRPNILSFVQGNSLNAVFILPGRQTVNDATWNDVDLPHVLNGSILVESIPSLGIIPTLQLAPGLVVKSQLSNIVVGDVAGSGGATFVADADLTVGESRIVLTSLYDDNRGPKGFKHDTSNNGTTLDALPGDWGGITFNANTTAIINGVEFQFGGSQDVPGVPPNLVPGTGTTSSNPILLADGPVFATITNNIIGNTLNLRSLSSTTPARNGAADVSAIAIDPDALGAGPNIARLPENPNPFIRGNDVLSNNGINGLEILARNAPFTPAIVAGDLQLDDTDIVHVVLGRLEVGDFSTLRLLSNPAGTFDQFDGFDLPGRPDAVAESAAEPLVMKFGGAGNTTNLFGGVSVGRLGTVEATLIVQGIPGDERTSQAPLPVVLTSLRDDAATTGGRTTEDTNNDASTGTAATTTPALSDWGGVFVGNFARAFGRISPLNNATLFNSVVDTTRVRYAINGIEVFVASPQVSNSTVTDSLVCITANGGAYQIFNNVMSNCVTGLVAFTTNSAAGPLPVVVNNVSNGNLQGVSLSPNVLFMNNAITNNTTAITGGNTITRNLYFGNTSDPTAGVIPAAYGDQPIVGRDPLFRNTATFDFAPTVGSGLVDAARSEFGSIVNPAFGLVRTPPRDARGLLRRDHAGTPNVGLGSQPFFDIGPFELVDVVSALPRVVAMTPAPLAEFLNESPPATIDITFSEPVLSVDSSTFLVRASGKPPGLDQGDGNFTSGNELPIAGTITTATGSNNTRFIFTPSTRFPTNEAIEVTLLGTGTPKIVSVNGVALDGDGLNQIPSGDGFEGGNFVARFTVGELLTGNIFFVDDTEANPDTACPPNVIPNRTPTYLTIPAALACAVAGDTILVRPGLYTAPFAITVPVTIESTDGALPQKNANNTLVPGTGTIIQLLAPIQVTNVAGGRIGSTRGGQNHGFIITTAPPSGGPVANGISLLGSAPTIEGNLFLSNQTAIVADSGQTPGTTTALPTILNNLFIGNTTAAIDVTSRLDGSLAKIVNNTITFNQAGIQIRDDGNSRTSAEVRNNIVTSNTISGISALVSSRPTVENNDVWGNNGQSTNFGGNLPNLAPVGTATSCAENASNPDDLARSTDENGNLSVCPQFRSPVDPRNVGDRADFLRFADFQLQSVSKLIDRGLDKDEQGAVVAAIRDFRGTTRLIDIPGVGNNTPPPPPPEPDSPPRNSDIGAYEFVSGSSGAAGARVAGRAAVAPAETVDSQAMDLLLAAATEHEPADEWSSLVDWWLGDSQFDGWRAR